MEDNNGMTGPGAGAGRPKRIMLTPAQAQAKRNAELAANAKRRAVDAEAKRKAAANLKIVTGRLGGVTIPGDDLLASLLGAGGGGGGAAPAPGLYGMGAGAPGYGQAYGMGAGGAAAAAAPRRASPYLLRLKREYDDAIAALQLIEADNKVNRSINEEGKETVYISKSGIGISKRYDAEKEAQAAKNAFEAQHAAEGHPSLAGGGRRRKHKTRRTKKTKKSRHANRKSRRSRR